MPSTYPDTRAGAIQCLTDNATEAVTALAAQKVEDGTAAWIPDPEVAGVWGLVLVGSTKAHIVVYVTDDDFEVSAEFAQEARA